MEELKCVCTCNSWPNTFCDKCQKHPNEKEKIFNEFASFNSDVKIKNLLYENLHLRKQLIQYHKYIEHEISYEELQTYIRTIKDKNL